MHDNVEKFTDFKARDSKESPYDSTSYVVITLLLKLPTLIFVVVPIVIITNIIEVCVGLCISASDDAEVHDSEDHNGARDDDAEPMNLELRRFDIVIVGAYGYTGTKAAIYMARNYSKTVKWAIAGRDIQKLEQLRGELTQYDTSLANMPTLIVDVTDRSSCAALCNQTRVLANAAGPYAKYGQTIVSQAVVYGCSYVDITSEASWAREMSREYAALAANTGARIVNFAGHDCVPVDLCVLQLFETLKDVNPETTIDRIELYEEGRAKVSGGTIDTYLYHKKNYHPERSKIDPFDVYQDGERSWNRITNSSDSYFGYSGLQESWYVSSYVAAANYATIRRSNVLKNYGAIIRYKDQLLLPSFSAVCAWYVDAGLFACMALNSTFRTCARGLGLMPSPGEGPSDEEMDEGYFLQHGHCIGMDGSYVAAQLYFKTDTLYRLTAAMFIESALCFVIHNEEIESQGGFYTPAGCFDSFLRDRLLRANLCEIETRIIRSSLDHVDEEQNDGDAGDEGEVQLTVKDPTSRTPASDEDED